MAWRYGGVLELLHEKTTSAPFIEIQKLIKKQKQTKTKQTNSVESASWFRRYLEAKRFEETVFPVQDNDSRQTDN